LLFVCFNAKFEQNEPDTSSRTTDWRTLKTSQVMRLRIAMFMMTPTFARQC
jgi:hypothetical protein